MKKQVIFLHKIKAISILALVIGITLSRPLLFVPKVNAQAISQLNVRQQGYLNKRSHKTYKFRGQENKTVTISLTSGQFDTYLELYNPSGRLIAQNNNTNGTNSQIRLNLPASGTYTVVVKGVKNSAQGKYALIIKGESSIQPPTASPGRVNSRQKNHLFRGEKIQHTFQARAGQLIAITLESPQFNSHLALYGTDGRLLVEAKDFDSSSSKIQLPLPDTGVYTVEVRGINSNAEGEYTLTIAEQQ